ncbi:hypothetical protein HUE46_13760 [Flavobacterium columnare]|uniref:hypothetical protein n=1 Tax=Flavobacterium columnare TaxID=996 RepID=UPI001780F8D4|nr:hypothetical protein [Flavobacterium columnare]MBF6652722.1 hypothetical protein [Flavobacterium columnare]QOG90982.1 hypothetical protein HUE41_13760 [Flavobacterium columnare]QOG93636.1 hypothetical protein HUE42_13755 [Flavobacterium columnare]QOG96303.1 hypothetical protein HUE43_13755 [Flavobacterium columnare]QOG98962.1 hypothetical protein HUE44_13755 [Flavobacterium columnare]
MEIKQTLEERIYNWIKIGFQQPSERISELFYFDKRDNQFFSILITDYFHFDEDYNIPKNATSSYPENILKLLADRMMRIENDDKSIISLPRTNKEEITSDEYLNKKIENFLNINSIDIKTATIWDIDTVGSVTINLKDDTESASKIDEKKWWKFWK